MISTSSLTSLLQVKEAYEQSSDNQGGTRSHLFRVLYSLFNKISRTAAFCLKLYCLSRLIPPDPSGPSDSATQKREDRRAGRTVTEEIRRRLCTHCDLVEADRNTFLYANYGMLNLKSTFTYAPMFMEQFHQ